MQLYRDGTPHCCVAAELPLVRAPRRGTRYTRVTTLFCLMCFYVFRDGAGLTALRVVSGSMFLFYSDCEAFDVQLGRYRGGPSTVPVE